MSAIPPATSGEYNFRPDLAEIIIDAYERIGIGPAVLDDPKYIIGAIRSSNLLLADISANRGINLFAVGDETVNIPLVAGQASYLLPDNLIMFFDCFIRTYTPDRLWRDVGFAPTIVMGNTGEPILSEFGEPQVANPGSETFWTQEGSPYVTMRWPGHGLMEGAPVFFQTPTTAGALTIKNFVVVAKVLDPNTFTFVVPYPAPATRNGCGGTTLFVSREGQDFITVHLPFHWYQAGDVFPVNVPTEVGGICLHGMYNITTVLNPHTFLIPTIPGPAPPTSDPVILSERSTPQTTVGGGPALDSGLTPLPIARFTDTAYENGGTITACSQAAGVQWTDVIIWGISRNDYAFLPNKQVMGRPSVFWFNRAETPNRLYLWAVPAFGNHWAFIGYRSRYLESSSPDAQPDLPRRFLPAYTAMLCASLAEKFAPERFAEKTQIAEALWQRAADADREMVSSFIRPTLQNYWR